MTKQQAVKCAEDMLAQLKDKKGWEIRVWNNTGWYYALKRGGMNLFESVYPDGKRSYWTLFSADGKTSGESFWGPSFVDADFFKTPDEAVAHQLTLAQEFTNHCNAAIDDFLSRGGRR